jgi:orotidine-5'-phosphate decarboxylase
MPQIARRLLVSSFGSRLLEVFSERGQLCVGIDPSADQLNSWGIADTAAGAREFALAIIEASSEHVGIVKPQVAFFEQYGPSGLQVLSEVLAAAKQAGLMVIADAKRGDIGSSMAGYTRAWLAKEASFQADALTVSPFLGLESLRPSIDVALENQKGVFLLAATSNPEARVIQSAVGEGGTISNSVASFASSFDEAGLGSVGLVVGATVSLGEVGIDASSLARTPILMPGFGAQGVDLSSAHELFGELTPNLVCSVSRSVAGSSRSGLSDRIEAAKDELDQAVSR